MGSSKINAFELSLFADYFQFYIKDEAAVVDLSQIWSSEGALQRWSEEAAQRWNEEATSRLLAIAPGKIGIGTVRNMDVPVVIEIHDREPDEDFSHWDHVVEAALDVASGKIVVAGCTEYFPDAKRIEIPSGSYRVRVSYGDLDTLSEDGLRGEDHYRVEIWPGSSTAVQVLKQRPK